MGGNQNKNWYQQWWVWAAAASVLILLTSNCSSRWKNENNQRVKPADAHTEAALKHRAEDNTVFHLQETVKNGELEYTVLEVKDTGKIGKTPDTMKTAQNNFVVVKVRIKNVGKDTQWAGSHMFKLKDEMGAEYSCSAGDSAYVNERGHSFFMEQINPEEETAGYAVFETPTKNADSAYTFVVKSGGWRSKKVEIVLAQQSVLN